MEEIKLENELSEEHAQKIRAFKNDLLIVLIKRLGGDVLIPVEEIDGVKGEIILMEVEGGNSFRIRSVRSN